MNFVSVRDLVINLDQIAYIDRSRNRIVLVGRIEVFLTQQEIDAVAELLDAEQTVLNQG